MEIAGRTIPREAVVEAVASVGVVATFIAVVVWIGVTHDGGTGLPAEGGLALVGAIALFVFLVSAVGAWLAYQ